MGLEMGTLGSISVDVRHKAAPPPPRPPPQPIGPRPPLGPCTADLAPWAAVQAPKPHPIRPEAGAVAIWSAAAVRGQVGVFVEAPHPRDQSLPGRTKFPWGPRGVVQGTRGRSRTTLLSAVICPAWACPGSYFCDVCASVYLMPRQHSARNRRRQWPRQARRAAGGSSERGPGSEPPVVSTGSMDCFSWIALHDAIRNSLRD